MTGIGVACAVAGLVVGTLAMTDLTGKISSAMFTLAKGSQMLTLMIATIVVIVLGMGMPTPAVYALSAVLAGPALLALGVPMLPAHLFIVYFASMSAITPPVAVAAFAAGSIARANPMAIGFLCCRLAMVAFLIPFVFIYHPGMLLIGDTGDDRGIAGERDAGRDRAGERQRRLSVHAAADALARAVSGWPACLLITTQIVPALLGGLLLLGGGSWLWAEQKGVIGRANTLVADFHGIERLAFWALLNVDDADNVELNLERIDERGVHLWHEADMRQPPQGKEAGVPAETP